MHGRTARARAKSEAVKFAETDFGGKPLIAVAEGGEGIGRRRFVRWVSSVESSGFLTGKNESMPT